MMLSPWISSIISRIIKRIGIVINSRKVCIVYEAFITGIEQLRSNETALDMSTLDEECRIDGMF